MVLFREVVRRAVAVYKQLASRYNDYANVIFLIFSFCIQVIPK
jgi:hypothetical protein